MSMKPILFNTEMVRAILDGRKSVTRRAVKLKYSNTHLTIHTDKYGTRLVELQNEEPGVTTVRNSDGTTTRQLLAVEDKIPPYRPGDILYVRETWIFDTGNPGDEGGTGYFAYKADGEKSPTGRWHPSIHMPKEAARLFLRVTNVWAERLQSITPEQVDAEGCKEWAYSAQTGELLPSSPGWFKIQWGRTIKKADLPRYGWDANPWVWVIEFERVSKDEAMKND